MLRWRSLLGSVVLCTGWLGLTGGIAAAELESRPFNFNPTTGLINVPIAQVATPGQVDVTVERASFNDRKDDSGTLRVGVEPQLELAVQMLDSSATTFNAQLLVIQDPEISAAVGVQNLFGREPGIQEAQGQGKVLDPAAYLIFTRPLSKTVRGHYGVGSGRFSGAFGGFDYRPVPSLQLMVEWDGQEANAGARWTAVNLTKPDGSGLTLSLTGAYLDLSEPSLRAEVSFVR